MSCQRLSRSDRALLLVDPLYDVTVNKCTCGTVDKQNNKFKLLCNTANPQNQLNLLQNKMFWGFYEDIEVLNDVNKKNENVNSPSPFMT